MYVPKLPYGVFTLKINRVKRAPQLFSQLVQNYKRAGASRRLKFENAALSDRTGVATFYVHKSADFNHASDMRSWKTQVGSLQRKYGSKSIPVVVKATTFNALLDDHNILRVDYLQVDAEGLDAFVIEQVSLSAVRARNFY
eukprot:4681855-Pyramimonas_sp.AAC.1